MPIVIPPTQIPTADPMLQPTGHDCSSKHVPTTHTASETNRAEDALWVLLQHSPKGLNFRSFLCLRQVTKALKLADMSRPFGQLQEALNSIVQFGRGTDVKLADIKPPESKALLNSNGNMWTGEALELNDNRTVFNNFLNALHNAFSALRNPEPPRQRTKETTDLANTVRSVMVDIAAHSITDNPESFTRLPAFVTKTRAFTLKAVEKHPKELLSRVGKVFLKDSSIIAAAVKKDLGLLSMADTELLGKRSFLDSLAKNTPHGNEVYSYATPPLAFEILQNVTDAKSKGLTHPLETWALANKNVIRKNYDAHCRFLGSQVQGRR